MSIKGKRKELYIGKTECNIITFWGNKITIEYEDLKRIDYQYYAPGQRDVYKRQGREGINGGFNGCSKES